MLPPSWVHPHAGALDGTFHVAHQLKFAAHRKRQMPCVQPQSRDSHIPDRAHEDNQLCSPMLAPACPAHPSQAEFCPSRSLLLQSGSSQPDRRAVLGTIP